MDLTYAELVMHCDHKLLAVLVDSPHQRAIIYCQTCDQELVSLDDPDYEMLPEVTEMTGDEWFELDVLAHQTWWQFLETMNTTLGTPGRSGKQFGTFKEAKARHDRAVQDFMFFAQVNWTRPVMSVNDCLSVQDVRRKLWLWYEAYHPEHLKGES